MEIEAGEYVRTESEQIYKLSYYNEEEKRWISVTNEDWFPVYASEIVKHSKNIIDLIEVGDYVNGYNILEKEGIVLSDGRYAFTVFKRQGHNFVKIWREEDIKSIVTKEMFASVEYKVGEE